MIRTKPRRDTAPTVEVRWPRPAVAQVILEGEHDLATHEQLDAKLTLVLASCSHLIVDLSSTLFIDSSTIRVLIASKERANAAGRHFNLLLGTEPIVERVLEITGVLPALNRVHSLKEAIATGSWFRQQPTRQ